MPPRTINPSPATEAWLRDEYPDLGIESAIEQVLRETRDDYTSDPETPIRSPKSIDEEVLDAILEKQLGTRRAGHE